MFIKQIVGAVSLYFQQIVHYLLLFISHESNWNISYRKLRKFLFLKY